MDNYDEKLNYSFEPADPVPAEPAQPLQQVKEEIRRSGRHTGLKIAALLTVVAIVAAAGGYALKQAIAALEEELERAAFRLFQIAGTYEMYEQSVQSQPSRLSSRNLPLRPPRSPRTTRAPTALSAGRCPIRSRPTTRARRSPRRRSTR